MVEQLPYCTSITKHDMIQSLWTDVEFFLHNKPVHGLGDEDDWLFGQLECFGLLAIFWLDWTSVQTLVDEQFRLEVPMVFLW